MRTSKRLLAVVLTLCLVLSYAAPSVLAADEVTEVVYTNSHSPSSAVVAKVESVGDYVIPNGSHTAVQGEDGYYYLDSADGDLLVVPFNEVPDALWIDTLSDIVSNPRGFKYTDSEGNKTDYTAALKEYVQVGNYYPLTWDLLQMLQKAGASAGWYYGTYSGADAYLSMCKTAAWAHVHNMEHHEAVAAGEHTNGMKEYWYCAGCDCYFSDAEGNQNTNAKDVVIPSEHKVVHYAAVEPDCLSNGMKEMWYCKDCDVYYLDEECNYNTNPKNQTIPALGHNIEKVEACEATCDSPAMDAYLHCTRCDTYYAVDDTEAKYPLPIKNFETAPALGHTMNHVEKVEAGCEDGMEEYWYCSVCDTHFADAEGKQNVSYLSLVIPGTGHTMEHHEAVAATCVENGMKEYWHCTVCGGIYADENGDQPVAYLSLVIPASHKLEHIEASEATCDAPAMKAHLHCIICDDYFNADDEEGQYPVPVKNFETAPALGHTMNHVEKVEAGCEDGMEEYWYCSVCDTHFADAEGKQNVSYLSLVIPGTGHTMEHHEAVAATCDENGMKEYWHCTVCDGIYADENGDQPVAYLSLVIPAGHKLEHVAASDASCDQPGMLEYWHCIICDTYYLDEDCTQVTNHQSLVDPSKPAPGHKVEHVAASDASCDQPGMYEYWHCIVCDTYYTDEACTQVTNYKNLVDPSKPAPGHKVEHVAASDATCTDPGMFEYWHCTVCDTYYTDEACTQVTNYKSLTDPAKPALGHKMVKIEAEAPTCTATGMKEHWHCTVCDTFFADEAGKQPVAHKSMEIPALGHKLEHHEAVAATETKDGMKEYWYCSVCDVYFTDAEGKYPIASKSLVIPATGTKTPSDSKNPNTGDNSQIFVWSVLAMVSCAGLATVVVINKKRKAC